MKYNLESEQAALAAAIEDHQHVPDLSMSWWYDDRNRLIHEAIIKLDTQGHKPTFDALITTLPMPLKVYLSECMNACHSAANFTYWKEQLTELAESRAAFVACQNYTVSDCDAKAIDELEAALTEARKGHQGGRDLSEVSTSLLARWEQAALNPGAPTGLMTGFANLDSYLCGLEPGNLVILAARPAVGKTSMALSIASKCLSRKLGVGLFSLEMTGEELLERMTCMRTGLDAQGLRTGNMDDAERARAGLTLAELTTSGLLLDDRGGLSLAEIRATARKWYRQNPMSLLIVDYLQLVKGTKRTDNRVNEVAEISGGLKALAKELNLPCLVLSQLSRDSAKNEREPRLYDLRDSGAIEQDADSVLMLHPGDTEADGLLNVRCYVRKNRSGPVGAADLVFDPKTTSFCSAVSHGN